MSTISPISNALIQTAIATASLPSDPANTSSQTNGSSANQPAALVSLSSAAGVTQNAVFAQPRSNQVASVLNLVAGANGAANDVAIFEANYAKFAAKYGVDIANRNLGETQGAVAQPGDVITVFERRF